MSQTQPPDLSRPLRRPSERLALVEYVAGSPSLQENEHLEWKSGYDLSRRPDAGKVAKQLIGFSNRDPMRAKRLVGGYGYVLLGVEAGAVRGVPVWDSADIESWLSRFVPSELVYDIHYVKAMGADVLFLEADPPRAGDAIFCLQASTGDGDINLTEGTIYVRRGGKTEPANATEIAMLTERAKSGGDGTELDLDVVVASQDLSVLEPQSLLTPVRERWVERERGRLMEPVPTNSFLPFTPGESRSPAEYEEQVEAHLAEIVANWPTFALSQHVVHSKPSLALAIANRTDENFESVVVEITVPLPAGYVRISPESVAEAVSGPSL